MSSLYQSIPTLIVIGFAVLIFIGIMLFLRGYVWWLFGIQKQIDQNDEIILLLKYIAAGKTIPVQPAQGAQSVLPPAVNPLTKRP
jgi:predicted tellurium resistance membrane protein TerC